jgi:YidC/Oxa1 family membrane protein insertase
MDKKSTIGLILIGVILAVWVYMTGPTKEQIEQRKRHNDSIAAKIREEEEKARLQAMAQQLKSKISVSDSLKDTTLNKTSIAANLDSIKKSDWQDFYPATKGTEEILFLENEKIKAFISTKSGRITNVVLKEFLMPDKKTPVELFKKDSAAQSVYLNCYNNKLIPLDSLFFIPDKKSVTVSSNGTGTLKLKMPLERNGAYIEYVYSLKANDYMVGYQMNFIQMDSIITPGSKVEMVINMLYPSQEKHIEKEKQIATVYYCDKKGNSDNLSQTSSDSTTITDIEMKWIALKQQFFSTVLINDDLFDTGTKLKISTLDDEKNPRPDLASRFVKNAELKVVLPDPLVKNSYSLKYYFGPNHYLTLKDYDLGMEEMIPMGWSIFSYINKWLVVPVFHLFRNSDFGFGWVILILTLVIKGLLFPIGYMTYKSSAKMKVLKPETDAINEKYGKDGDPMKKQQETMALYGRAGVSPFSGCLPLIFQMFVLIALFNFFPAAIELRQQPFWWSDDLSTYDSILDFGFHIPMYGDHVSLFALLMFLSTLGFTFYQQKMFPNQQTNMPGMKFMMYAMPFIFLGFMNSYSAGLSWYYFVANIVNILQNVILRKFVDEDKLRAEVDINLKNPARKKTGFTARLEQMAKERQQMAKRK